MAKLILLAVIGCFTSMVVSAADLSAVAGHYRYEEYSVTLPNGRTLQLSDLGVTEGFLDISDAGSITLRMTMRASNTVVQTAKVVEAHIAQGKGYCRADPERLGSVEHAVLRKMRVSDE
jgi:hypothetical protein